MYIYSNMVLENITVIKKKPSCEPLISTSIIPINDEVYDNDNKQQMITFEFEEFDNNDLIMHHHINTSIIYNNKNNKNNIKNWYWGLESYPIIYPTCINYNAINYDNIDCEIDTSVINSNISNTNTTSSNNNKFVGNLGMLESHTLHTLQTNSFNTNTVDSSLFPTSIISPTSLLIPFIEPELSYLYNPKISQDNNMSTLNYTNPFIVQKSTKETSDPNSSMISNSLLDNITVIPYVSLQNELEIHLKDINQMHQRNSLNANNLSLLLSELSPTYSPIKSSTDQFDSSTVLPTVSPVLIQNER